MVSLFEQQGMGPNLRPLPYGTWRCLACTDLYVTEGVKNYKGEPRAAWISEMRIFKTLRVLNAIKQGKWFLESATLQIYLEIILIDRPRGSNIPSGYFRDPNSNPKLSDIHCRQESQSVLLQGIQLCNSFSVQ